MADGKNSYVIGIDAGTTSIKGMLMDNTGRLAAIAKEEYTLDTGAGEICELEAEVYWEVACRVIHEILKKSGVHSDFIKGVSFSSQGETLIPIGFNGKPLRKAIVWLDNRSVEEANEIKEKFGEQYIMDITGQAEIVPMWPATRILWLRKNEPEIYNQVKKYLLVEDYLIYKMTGRCCTEHSLVSSTLFFDITKKVWWDEMLDFIGISKDQLPELLKSGTPAGKLIPEAAEATGLSTDTECVTGSYDHPAGALGSGNIHSGDVTLTIGASMAMCAAISKPISDLSIKLPCQCHAIDGLYFLQPYAQTAGMVLKWFKDEFCQLETKEAEQKGIDVYDLISGYAENIEPGSNGLVMLPHLMGTGSPEFNSKATGVFAGIKMGMGKGHFIRAIMEAVCLMVRHNLETMKKTGIETGIIHALGGASKSSLWNQMLADITGLPVSTLENTETSVTGACLLAGIGTGMFEDLETACKISVKKSSSYKPNPENHNIYNETYRKYVSLYSSLENYWKF